MIEAGGRAKRAMKRVGLAYGCYVRMLLQFSCPFLSPPNPEVDGAGAGAAAGVAATPKPPKPVAGAGAGAPNVEAGAGAPTTGGGAGAAGAGELKLNPPATGAVGAAGVCSN